MRNLFLAVLIVWAAPQEYSPRAARAFHWNWRESKELTASVDSLATSKDIREPDRAELLATLAEQFKSYQHPTAHAAKTRVKLIDLNGDGVPEAICQASDDESCSPTGNCSFWIFEKRATGYKLILSRGSVQTFTIQNGQTYSYHDLVLGMQSSATEQGLTRYQFRDGRYQRTGCYDANWTYRGQDGEYHDMKEPRITPRQC